MLQISNIFAGVIESASMSPFARCMLGWQPGKPLETEFVTTDTEAFAATLHQLDHKAALPILGFTAPARRTGTAVEQ